MPRGSWKGSGQTISVPVSEMNAGGVGPALLYQSQSWNNGQYRMMACEDKPATEDVPTPNAGTVMVSGGKAFYRSTSTTWSEYKVNSSTTPSVHVSRRSSAVVPDDKEYGDKKSDKWDSNTMQ